MQYFRFVTLIRNVARERKPVYNHLYTAMVGTRSVAEPHPVVRLYGRRKEQR